MRKSPLLPLIKGGRVQHGGILRCWRWLCPSLFLRTLLAFPLCFFILFSFVFAQYPPSYLGLSLSELETALGKVNGPISLAPRPGSEQGTLEARLAENAGLVQAAGSPGNLGVVVLWVPTDKGKFASAKSREYLEALVRLLSNESESILRWTEQVLERAAAEEGSTPYLESQLLDKRQFKATYLPTLSPPMLSLIVTGGGQGALR